MIVRTFLAAVMFAAASASAQSVGVVLQQTGTPVGTVSAITGLMQVIATTGASGTCLCQPAFSLASNELFFYAQPAFVPTIFAVNIQTAAVRSVAITPSNPASTLLFDPMTGQLLSLTGFGPGPLQITSIDPNTGAFQTLVNTGIAFASSDFALDPMTRRAFVLSSNSIGTQMLNTVNLTTGIVSTVSIASTTNNYDALHFDPVTNRVLSFGAQSGGGVLVLSIDPSTGNVQTLITIPPSTPFATVPRGMAFDPFSRLVTLFNGVTNTLAFINLTTGVITDSAPLPGIAGQSLPFGIVAIPPAAGATIPALGPAVLVLLGVSIAAIALRRL